MRSAMQLLSFPEINFETIEEIFSQQNEHENKLSQFEQKIKKQVAISAKYLSYLKRQEEDIEIFRRESQFKIPLDLDYYKIQSLSNEVREKLTKFRPATLGSALKIQGITTASIMAVMIYIKNLKK